MQNLQFCRSALKAAEYNMISRWPTQLAPAVGSSLCPSSLLLDNIKLVHIVSAYPGIHKAVWSCFFFLSVWCHPLQKSVIKYSCTSWQMTYSAVSGCVHTNAESCIFPLHLGQEPFLHVVTTRKTRVSSYMDGQLPYDARYTRCTTHVLPICSSQKH